MLATSAQHSAQQPPPHPWDSGSSPRFQTLKFLGKGGQGFVQLAYDNLHQQRVAIKYIDRGWSRGFYKYVLRETLNHQQLSLCKHPHIVEFYEVFLTPSYLAVVMEYVNGTNLQHYLEAAGGKLPEDVARFIFQQLVVAVDFCHRKGKVNRDIKLANILLQEGHLPLVKLCDFGFSKDKFDDSEPQTQIGTALFTAPEIFTNVPGQVYDAEAADVWSCGVVLFVMLFGCHPFLSLEDTQHRKHAQVMKLIENAVRGNVQVPPGAEELYPQALDLVRRILVSAPGQRCKLPAIMSHPWFQDKLPPGALLLNAAYLAMENPVGELRQTPEEVHAIITAALSAGAAETDKSESTSGVPGGGCGAEVTSASETSHAMFSHQHQHQGGLMHQPGVPGGPGPMPGTPTGASGTPTCQPHPMQSAIGPPAVMMGPGMQHQQHQHVGVPGFMSSGGLTQQQQQQQQHPGQPGGPQPSVPHLQAGMPHPQCHGTIGMLGMLGMEPGQQHPHQRQQQHPQMMAPRGPGSSNGNSASSHPSVACVSAVAPGQVSCSQGLGAPSGGYSCMQPHAVSPGLQVSMSGDYQRLTSADQQRLMSGDHQRLISGDHQRMMSGDHQRLISGDHQRIMSGDHQRLISGDHQRLQAAAFRHSSPAPLAGPQASPMVAHGDAGGGGGGGGSMAMGSVGPAPSSMGGPAMSGLQQQGSLRDPAEVASAAAAASAAGAAGAGGHRGGGGGGAAARGPNAMDVSGCILYDSSLLYKLDLQTED